MKGLELVRELEGELERLVHVDLALVGVVAAILVLVARPRHVKV